jgi:CzcA family heavy metal efflux pump
MFRWIIGTSLQLRALIVGIAVTLVAFGAFQLQKMPVSVFPEFGAPVVEVQTEALGLSAEEVRSLVTLNIEEILSGVPWLESLESESVMGLSSIKLTFERGTDLNRARQMVQERMTLAYALPNVSSTPTMLQPLSATSRFLMIGLSSDSVEETDLSLLARWGIKPRLLGVPGVANVAIWGQRLREMQVHVDSERLREASVIQDEVIQAAGDALWITPLSYLRGSTPGTGGWIDNHNQRLGVFHKMPIVEPEDMAKVAVTSQHLLSSGKKMALGDVAEVTYAHPQLIGDAYVNGGTGLLMVIEKFPSANTLEVTRGVEEAMADLARGLPGVDINTDVFRLATYMETSILNLETMIIIGAILVVLVIGAFLFNYRAALISIVSIPVALLTAIGILSFTGATLNTMVLAGLVIALGVVIDDAVVDVEKIMRRLHERQEGGPSVAQIVFRTTLETRSATVYAALIVLLAVAPIFFMGGAAGAFFEPLALAYVLAVAASLLVGLSLTPALSLMFFGKTTPQQLSESPIAASLRRGYEGLLGSVMKAPTTAMIGGAALLLVGAVTWPLLGQSLLPALEEREVVVNWNTPPGTSYGETYRVTSRVSQELEELSGVRNVSAHIGRATSGDQIVGINSAQIWVGLNKNVEHDDMLNIVREVVDGYPGVDRSVQAYLRDTVSEAFTGASSPIVVRIFGQDREVLRQKAEEVREALSGIDGLVDLRVVGDVEEPQVRVRVDLDKAREAGVKPGEVRRSAATVFAGLNVGFLYEDQKIFDVRVWSAPEARHSLNNLKEVLVEKSDRHRVRLDEVADVSMVSVPTSIKATFAHTYVDVVANVSDESDRDLGSVTKDVEAKLATVDFPLEYHPELLGEYLERQDAQNRTIGVAIAALVGIFLLLQACFRSWGLATIGFLAIPASAAGGVIAVLLSGDDVSLGSIVGFFAVVGIAARNGILLITHYQQLEAEERVAFGLDLVVRGARERFVAIAASSGAIIAALLPIMVVGSIAGLEFVEPTAIVIVGGLIASTLVTLFVLPALYLVLGSRSQRQLDLGLSET